MFDGYHKWLGIPKDQRPPTHYQLLGISPDEKDIDVIEEAAIRQTTYLRSYQSGEHGQECARILGEIAKAKKVLLDPKKRKEYDATLPKKSKKDPDERVISEDDLAKQSFQQLAEDPDSVVPSIRRRKEAARQSDTPWIPIAAGGGGILVLLLGIVGFMLLGRSADPGPVGGPKVVEVKKEKIEKALELTSLQEVRHRLVGNISQGESPVIASPEP